MAQPSKPAEPKPSTPTPEDPHQHEPIHDPPVDPEHDREQDKPVRQGQRHAKGVQSPDPAPDQTIFDANKTER